MRRTFLGLIAALACGSANAAYLGDFVLGATVPIYFPTFGGSNESITITGLAVTDIEVYKGTSMTQRASDTGYTLIDTDGIDVDTTTGIHGFVIDTSDDSDAGFWVAGSDYNVVVNAITVNSQTVRFVDSFSIMNRAGSRAVHAGRATGGDATSIDLAAAASATNDYYGGNGNGYSLEVLDGACEGQHYSITDYDGTGKSATVSTAWVGCTPDTTSLYAIWGPQRQIIACNSAGRCETNLYLVEGADATDTLEALTVTAETAITTLTGILTLTGTCDSGSTTTCVDDALTHSAEAMLDDRMACYDDDADGNYDDWCARITGFTPASDTVTHTKTAVSTRSGKAYAIYPATAN